jgi:DNA-nicking Smr family endonuclease
VKEAIGHTNRVLKEARELGNSEIRIIVGRGKHSKDGLAKLKPAIQAFLEK